MKFELPVPLFIYLKYCQYQGMTFSKNENKINRNYIHRKKETFNILSVREILNEKSEITLIIITNNKKQLGIRKPLLSDYQYLLSTVLIVYKNKK